MRSCLIVAAIIAGSSAAVASEAFIPQSAPLAALRQDLTSHATAASLAVPLSLAALTTTAAAPSAANLPGNISNIVQQGTRNLATVSQTGGFNQSTIAQTGSGNQAIVTQRR